METDTAFRPCKKFPEYEVSVDGVVRNRKYLNIVLQHVEFADLTRARRVRIIRNQNIVVAFVQELINDAWPETRMGNIAA